MISKIELIRQICRLAGIARKRNGLDYLTKDELYKIHAYLYILNERTK